MDRAKLDTWCERGILGLVLAILIFAPLATGAVRPGDFVVVQWLTVALLAVWGCRFAINPKHRLLWPWFCWPALGFILYAAGRYWTAEIEYVARQEFVHVLVYSIILLAVLNNLHRKETTHILVLVLLVLGTVIALYAVVQYVTGSEQVWHFLRPEVYRGRGSGTFINPNNLAGYLEMLLPLALAFMVGGRLKELQKVVFGYAALMIFAGLVVTFSRGGWLAAGVSLSIFFAWVSRRREYWLQGILVLTGFAAVIFVFGVLLRPTRAEGHPDRLTEAARAEDIRFKLWAPALRMWRDHFWWGAGPGHFDYRFRQYRPADPQLQVRPVRVHNDYLNTLVDYGVAGALLAGTAWSLFFAEVFKCWRFVRRPTTDLGSKRSNKSAFVLGGALGLTALLVHSWVDFNLHIPANAILAMVLLGLVSGHFRFATEKHWHTVRWGLRIPVFLFLGASLVFLGSQSWRGTMESVQLNRAERAEFYSDARVTALAMAFDADNKNSETAYELGETLRRQSWEADQESAPRMRKAVEWFQRAAELNPYYPYNFMRIGMCLDWLGRSDEAADYFNRARGLDPHGYYTLAHVGWHYAQVKDWPQARKWFEQSLTLNTTRNKIAQSYLEIVKRHLDSPEPAGDTAFPNNEPPVGAPGSNNASPNPTPLR